MTYLGGVPAQPDHPPDPPPADNSYAERLWVPIGWWVLTVGFALSLAVAVLFYWGPAFATGAGLLVLAPMAPLWIGYGRARVVVAPDRLWVGQANIEWRYLSRVQSLDPIQTRQRRGIQADARAFVLTRPYLDKAVEVTLADPDDPTPYWLVGSRTPNRLANAIRVRLATTEDSGAATDT